jgi:signal transduction histidine kinase
VYFAVAELLTNTVKHAAAPHAWVWIRHDDGVLTAMVGDDGVGGAQPTAEGGLAGVQRRLAAFDGTLSVASPLGGGTIVTIKVPCVLRVSTAA